MSLRATIMRGGAYLAVRQALGTIIAIAGVLLLTRIVGPAQFGLFAAAVGIFTVAQLISQLGINVYIIRSESEVDARLLNTAATLMVLLGIVVGAVLIALAPSFAEISRLQGLAPVAIVIFAALPLTQLAQVPLAVIERQLDYRRAAWAELISQAMMPLVAIPLALQQPTAMALVIGWWAQQLTLFILLHGLARFVPRPALDRRVARDAIEYGIGYAASTWLYQLRRLVNPLIVGRYLGAEAVGIVSITTQFVTHLSFISVATWRLSTAALARIQADRDKIGRAIGEGMSLQVLAVAPFLLAFAIAGPFIVPTVMGPEWSGIMDVYPFIAIVALATSVFNLHASALYVLRRNWAMAWYHAVHTALLFVAALLFVPRYGLTGYGWAEIATLGAFWILHERAGKEVRLKYFLLPKDALKKLRDFGPINVAATTVVKFLVREPSLNLARLLPRTGLVEARMPNGRTLKLWSRADDLIASPVYWRGWDGYERETARVFYEHARDARVILDIGAHVGYFTVLGALANDDVRVFSFEPNPTVHSRLRRNIEVNGLTNVEAVQKAVGRAHTTAPFYFVPDGIPANSSLSFEYISVCDTVENTEVEVVAIDDFLAERNVVRVDLIKIDTETTEVDVLRGMMRTLEQSRPTILCEILSDDAAREIHSILDPLGYETRLVGADGRNYLFVARAR